MDDSLRETCHVVLHIGTGQFESAEKIGSPLVVSGRNIRFVLSDDIWIERLDEQLATNIQKACDPPNYKLDFNRRDRHLYAFVCPVSTGEKGSSIVYWSCMP